MYFSISIIISILYYIFNIIILFKYKYYYFYSGLGPEGLIPDKTLSLKDLPDLPA